MIVKWLFPHHRELLKRIESSNDSELSIWKINNILIPVFTISISIIRFLLFNKKEDVTIIAVVNLIVNGSIPMIALTRYGSVGSYIFKIDKEKENKYGLKLYYLRTRIFYLFIALLLLTVILYVYQVLNSPFVDGLVLVSIILFSVISVWFSFDVAKTIYLLHDKMIDNTFDQDIRSEIDQKGHGQNW